MENFHPWICRMMIPGLSDAARNFFHEINYATAKK